MPAIDPSGNKAVVLKKKRTVRRRPTPAPRPSSPAPRPQGMSRTFTSRGSVRPAPRPQPRPTVTRRPQTLPRNFRSEAAATQGHRDTPSQRAAINRNLRQVRKRAVQRDRDVQARARARFGIKGQLGAERRAIESLAKLREANRAKYDENVKKREDARKGIIEDVIVDGAKDAQKVLGKAAEGTKSAIDWMNEKRTGQTARERSRMGLGPDTSVIGKEAADIVATTPYSIYVTAAAAKEAAGGDTKRAKALWKDYKETSALVPLAKGDVKEAAKRAAERPLTTALEVSGAKALAGRSAGTAARSGALGRKAKNYASTEREPLRLYSGSEPGEGPAVGRRYSKDLIDNRIQKARDRRKVRKGIDPNTRRPDRTVPNMTGGRSRIAPNAGPTKNALDDRVDRHVHSMKVMQNQYVRDAEKKAEKRGKAAEPMKVRRRPPSAAEVAKEYTRRNPRTQGFKGINTDAFARQAHDVLGIEKPVILKVMGPQRIKALEDQTGKTPRGYATESEGHYTVYVNTQHPANQGPKGHSNVVHYELGRIQGLQQGKAGPGATGSNNRAGYFENDNTKHAQEVMRAHISTDLREAPVELPQQQFTGSAHPTNKDLAGQRAAQAAQQTHLRKVVKDFTVRPNAKSHVNTYDEAMATRRYHEERLGEKLVPVNIARLTRMPDEPIVPRADDPHKLRLATSQEKAWKEAIGDHRNGQWVLMPERVVQRFIKHAEAGRNYGTLQRSANQFKDVVLTTSNPVRWLGGNVVDLGMRSVFEGLTPADLYRGARVHRELGRHGRRGELVKVSTTGGGFGHIARDVTGELSAPGAGAVAKVWGKYRAGVYGLESAIESLPQIATVGKELRTGKKADLKHGLKGLLRATDDQVQHFAREMVVDTATEMRVAKHVEDVIGKWGKLSPEARKMLAGAPFAQWLGASTRYVMMTLPAKHPIKTGIIAGLSEMTEKERMALGFSRHLPLKQQVQDYQMMTLPQEVGKDKYGPTVKGTDMARATSFGTVNDALGFNVGGFLFPQFMGAIQATGGTSWTGEPLKYQEGTPDAGMELSVEDKRKVALGHLAESFVPFAGLFRRVVQERGRPSMPQSTVLTPETRKKYDAQKKTLVERDGSLTEGLKRFAGWPVPGLPEPKKVYTKGAVNQMERSRTAIQEVKKWNAERSRKSKTTGDPEVDAFGSPKRNTDPDRENANLGGKNRSTKRKGVDPEVEAFK